MIIISGGIHIYSLDPEYNCYSMSMWQMFFLVFLCSTNNTYIQINTAELIIILTDFEVIQYVKICGTVYAILYLIMGLCHGPTKGWQHIIFSLSQIRKKLRFCFWLQSQRGLLFKNNSLWNSFYKIMQFEKDDPIWPLNCHH